MSNRRSPADLVRDTAWKLATGLLTGPSPEPRVRPARVTGERSAAGRILLVAGVLAAVAITALLVVVLAIRPARDSVTPEQAAALPDRRPAPVTTSASTSVAPTPAGTAPATTAPAPPTRATASAAPSPGPSGTPSPLAAAYTTTPYVVGLLGYRTEVTITNPGSASRQGWTLTVTLPRSTLWINEVKGATVTQQEAVWTFVPDATTAEIAAGEQLSMSFEVHGATLIDAAPVDCRIDDVPCTS